MPRRIFRRFSPTPHEIRKIPALNFLGALLHDPNLFHLNRHSISVAFFVGLFIAFLPIFGQIPLAAVAAFVFRCNLPIAVTLVWISNPLTFAFIYYGAYRLGARILQIPTIDLSFNFTWEWFKTDFLLIWQPLVLGCVLLSLFFGCLGYVSVQWLWRWHVWRKWRLRKEKRLARQTNHS